MTRRSRILTAAVLGLWSAQPLAARAAGPTTSLPPLPVATNNSVATATVCDRAPAAPTPPSNREMTSTVADVLRQAGKAGQLRHYNIDVLVKDGTAELSGSVASAQQREEVVKLVKGVAGVNRVVDKLTLLAPNPIAQVQATGPAVPVLQPPPTVGGGAGPELAPPPQVREPVPPPTPVPGPPNGVIPEPLPTFAAPPPSPYDLNPPNMPPYAWPSYAPYNNFSRVATPLAYPYQSWPFIGPPYPFPKIPPGWRSVKLEWQDGHWWFSRVATKNDWWRLRFW